MIRITPEERYWLEDNWSSTSRGVIRVLVPQAMDIADHLVGGAELDDRRWGATVQAWLAALEGARRASRVGGRGQMYATAISLFIDADPLRLELTGARARLDGPQLQAVVRACLRRGLLSMRYRLTSDSEHRSKIWTRIDRLSRKLHGQRVASGFERGADGRCNDEHIDALRRHILEHSAPLQTEFTAATVLDPASADGGLSQLPRKLDTLRGYFEEFCSDWELHDDIDSVVAADIAQMPDADRKIDYLEECIQTLDEVAREAVSAVYQLGPLRDVSTLAYCARTGIDRFKLYRRADKARHTLKACIEGKIEGEML